MVDKTYRQFHCGQSADGAHWQCKALGLKISIDATLHAYVHGQVKKKKKTRRRGETRLLFWRRKRVTAIVALEFW